MSEFADAEGNLLTSEDRRGGRRAVRMDGLTARELAHQEDWERRHEVFEEEEDSCIE